MPPRVEMVGRRYGRLLVLEPVDSSKGPWTWRARCDCGAEVVARGDDVRTGKHLSCGCLQSEATSRANLKHGRSRSRLYYVWRAMIQRCENPNNKRYSSYGARGIKVCDRWRKDFAAFAADVGECPEPGMSIDREDNDCGYEPSNVRWATRSQQSKNRRRWKVRRDTNP